MPYPFLSHAQLLDEGTLQELDTLVTRLRAFLQVAHREDGTLYLQPPGSGSGGNGGGSGIIPGLHHTTHEAGGADLVTVTEAMIALSDLLDDNVTIARHGFAPKLPGDPTHYLDGTGAYTVPPQTASAILEYDFSTALVEPPTLTQIRFNAAHPYTTVTKVWVRLFTDDGQDAYHGLMLVAQGSTIVIQDKNDHTLYAKFRTTADPVDKVSYVEYSVVWLANGGAIQNTHVVLARSVPPSASVVPPSAHHLTHEPGGTDPMAVDAATTTGSLRTLGTGAQQAAPGNDGRFSNARPPTAHAPTHSAGGVDPVAVTALAGYPGGASRFLRADATFALPTDLNYLGAYAAGTYHEGDIVVAADGLAYLCVKEGTTTPPEAWPLVATPPAHHTTHEAGGADVVVVSEPMIALTDLTTMNVSTARHGFAPKLPNDANRFFDGSGAYNPLNWTDVAFSAANFYASGAMTFTVTAGQVSTFAYTVHGKTALVTIVIDAAAVGGTAGTFLYIRLPVTTTRAIRKPFTYNSGSWATGFCEVPNGTNYVQCLTSGAANWTLGGVYLGIQLNVPI